MVGTSLLVCTQASTILDLHHFNRDHFVYALELHSRLDVVYKQLSPSYVNICLFLTLKQHESRTNASQILYKFLFSPDLVVA